MKTVVVVPTYNEAKNLPELVERLFALGLGGLELLVVDDASPDGTAVVARDLGNSYPGRISVLEREAKRGIGPAYVAGFQKALELGADCVVQMDADLSHLPQYIPAILEQLSTYDVVVASRYVVGGDSDDNWGLKRRVLSRIGNFYTKIASGVCLKDPRSGFKGYRREVLENIGLTCLRSKGFIFQTEVAARCQQMGSRVTEVPIVFYDRKEGQSKISFAIIFEAIWRLPLLRWRSKVYTGRNHT